MRRTRVWRLPEMSCHTSQYHLDYPLLSTLVAALAQFPRPNSRGSHRLRRWRIASLIVPFPRAAITLRPARHDGKGRHCGARPEIAQKGTEYHPVPAQDGVQDSRRSSGRSDFSRLVICMTGRVMRSLSRCMTVGDCSVHLRHQENLRWNPYYQHFQTKICESFAA